MKCSIKDKDKWGSLALGKIVEIFFLKKKIF